MMDDIWPIPRLLMVSPHHLRPNVAASQNNLLWYLCFCAKFDWHPTELQSPVPVSLSLPPSLSLCASLCAPLFLSLHLAVSLSYSMLFFFFFYAIQWYYSPSESASLPTHPIAPICSSLPPIVTPTVRAKMVCSSHSLSLYGQNAPRVVGRGGSTSSDRHVGVWWPAGGRDNGEKEGI